MVAAVEYVGNRTRNGRRLRNLNQGVVNADNTVTFPYAQYRLRQRLPRADRRQRTRRLRLAADADAAADVRRARLHARLHVEQGDGRLPRSPERGRRRHRQLPAERLQHGGRLRPAGLRHPAPLRRQRHLRAAVRRGQAAPDERPGGGGSRRLVGQRHPHAERRPSVHGHLQRHGGHRVRPHHARQLHRRPVARRLRSHARPVVRSRRPSRRPAAATTAPAAATPCAARARSR